MRRGRAALGAGPTALLLVLAVLLAGGLAAAGVVGLWRAARAAQTLARGEAQRAALAVARQVRALLEDPVLLERLAPGEVFVLEEAELVVPRRVGWIGAAPAEDPVGTVSLPALDRVRRAEAAGPGGGGVELAAGALEVPGLSRGPQRWVALGAGWLAWRAGEEEVLEGALAVLRRPPTRGEEEWWSVVAGSVLLLREAGEELPPWLVEAFGRLPPGRARAVLELLGEAGAGAGDLARALEEAVRQRGMLRRAAGLLPLLRAAAGPLLQAAGAEVLAYYPEGETAGTGRGALLAPQRLLPVLEGVVGGPAGEGLGLAAGARPSPEAVPAGPLLWVVPAAAPAAGRGWVPAALLGLLALLTGGGLVLSLRGVLREAAAVRARSEFLTSVTHELRTPLSSVRVLAELLEEEPPPAPEKRAEYLRLLAAEVGRLSALVENVLDLGRMERGQRSYDLARHPLAEVVREAVGHFAPAAAREGMEVRLDLSALEARGGGALALLDRKAFLQALLNVMDNARKYAAAGGVVHLEAQVEGGTCLLRVRDRGPGVPASERGRIFEPFRRGRAQLHGAQPGVGLGLHLARLILRAHGGDLALEAPPPGEAGACFTLRLPLASAAAAGEEAGP